MLSDFKKFKKKNIKKLPKILGATLTCGVCALGVFGAVTAFNAENANNENINSQENIGSQVVATENVENVDGSTEPIVVKNVEKQDNIFTNISNLVSSFVNPIISDSNKTTEQVAESTENNIDNSIVNNVSDNRFFANSDCPGDLLINNGEQGQDKDWHFEEKSNTYYLHPRNSKTIITVENKDKTKTDLNSQLRIQNYAAQYCDDVNVMLNGVNLKSPVPIMIDNNAELDGHFTIMLADDSNNVLTATESHKAALSKEDQKSTLIIKAENEGSSNEGKLSAYGWDDAAGIGAGGEASLYNLQIYSGDIYAEGDGGSGIGTGSQTFTYMNNCSIFGGNIHAVGHAQPKEVEYYFYYNVCGIGSSSNLNGLYIWGGNIIAETNDRGCGIGCGRGKLNDLQIKGGNIKAYGGDDSRCPAIGCGYINDYNSDEVVSLEISGGTIEATSRCRGAGIGGGGLVDVKSIKISGSPTITAKGKDGAGIGASCLTCNKFNCVEKIDISGGNIIAIGDGGASGIGGGAEHTTDGWLTDQFDGTHINEINISGGNIEAIGGSNGGAGIGSGGDSKARDNNGVDVDDIIISGGRIKATSLNKGAGIGSGRQGNVKRIHISDTAKDGKHTFIDACSTNGGAGIGSGVNGHVGEEGKFPFYAIWIEGGSIIAQTLDNGDSYSIGAGDDGNLENIDVIKIDGGSIKTVNNSGSGKYIEGYYLDTKGNAVQLLKIENPEMKKVWVQNSLKRDLKPFDYGIYCCDPDSTDNPDFNLYMYQSVNIGSLVKVVIGDDVETGKVYTYEWDGHKWIDPNYDEGDLALTNIDPFSGEYMYDFINKHYYLNPSGNDDQIVEIQNKDNSVPSNCRVTINSLKNRVANIKLCGVNIESDVPIEIAEDNPGDVKIILADDSSNILTCINQDDKDCAALQKNSTTEEVGKLLIVGEEKGNGQLKATGQWDGAGIGSAEYKDARNIEIAGGDITAISGDGASFGSGQAGSVYDFVISGGTLKAQKTFVGGDDGDDSPDGAGIGSGSRVLHENNDVYGLTISNGDITAQGYHGAAVGSGSHGVLYNLTITGGTVKASNTWNDDHKVPNGAAVGSGDGGGVFGYENYHGIYIDGGYVEATSYDGAAVGTGFSGELVDQGLEIHGGVVITRHYSPVKGLAESDNATGAGIGTGNKGRFLKNAVIRISGGTIFSTCSNCNAACFGTGKHGKCEGKIIVTGGSITTKCYDSDGGYVFEAPPVDLNGHKVYQIDIKNENDCKVYVNGEEYIGVNQKGTDPSDPFLHGFLPDNYSHEVTVTLMNGKTKVSEMVYVFKSGNWQPK